MTDTVQKKVKVWPQVQYNVTLQGFQNIGGTVDIELASKELCPTVD